MGKWSKIETLGPKTKTKKKTPGPCFTKKCKVKNKNSTLLKKRCINSLEKIFVNEKFGY